MTYKLRQRIFSNRNVLFQKKLILIFCLSFLINRMFQWILIIWWFDIQTDRHVLTNEIDRIRSSHHQHHHHQHYFHGVIQTVRCRVLLWCAQSNCSINTIVTFSLCLYICLSACINWLLADEIARERLRDRESMC